ncbi:MAG: V-type ATP synthase subunit E [Actinobacteria bacterium]|nr:V-type ATP synthase subunit E [Actinomycetota bacterium]
MPIEELVTRIIRDANIKAGEFKRKVGAERERILSEAEKEADEIFDKQYSTLKRDAGEEKRRKITMAQMEARKGLLEEKQKLIDEVFERTIQALLGMPSGDYLKMLVRMLVSNAADKGGEIILSAEDRERFGRELIAEANSRLEESGKSTRFVLSDETRDLKGGFIIRSGGLEINNGFQVQLNGRREEFEPLLVRILFGEN